MSFFYIQENTVACKETRHLGKFPTRDFELSKSCSNLTLLAPNKGGLEVSKKVQYVSVAQRAAMLCFFEHFWKPPNPLYLEPRG